MVTAVSVPATAALQEADQQILLELNGDSSGVLIGRRGWKDDEIVERIRSCQAQGWLTWIDDADGFKRALAEGEPWGGFATKFALGRESYPGLDRLCALAAGQTG